MNDARLKEIEEAKWNGTISLDDCSDLIAALRESQAREAKLRELILLTDDCVSNEIMGALSLKQWTEYQRWLKAREALKETKP